MDPPVVVADPERVICELMGLADEAGRDLRQFRSRPGAHQYLRLYRLFEKYVAPGCEVLDWGAGNGHFCYYLVRAGYKVSGFSLKPCSFERWLPRGSYRVVQGDPSEPAALPFADGSFEAVASVGVLEHVRDSGGNELASLREIRRILKPGGHFVCYHLPNRYSLIEAASRRVPGKYHHRHRFTHRNVRALARAAGLELIESSRYGFLPRHSWNGLPPALRRARSLARLWDGTDVILSTIFSPLCQNYFFVARKS